MICDGFLRLLCIIWFENANISFHNGGENTNATNNPFTYRGYYYDADLGLYYLQSRYYDAKVGRFLNAFSFEIQWEKV